MELKDGRVALEERYEVVARESDHVADGVGRARYQARYCLQQHAAVLVQYAHHVVHRLDVHGGDARCSRCRCGRSCCCCCIVSIYYCVGRGGCRRLRGVGEVGEGSCCCCSTVVVIEKRRSGGLELRLKAADGAVRHQIAAAHAVAVVSVVVAACLERVSTRYDTPTAATNAAATNHIRVSVSGEQSGCRLRRGDESSRVDGRSDGGHLSPLDEWRRRRWRKGRLTEVGATLEAAVLVADHERVRILEQELTELVLRSDEFAHVGRRLRCVAGHAHDGQPVLFALADLLAEEGDRLLFDLFYGSR